MQPSQFAPAHCAVVLFGMVIRTGKMIHAVRHVQQKLLRHAPAFSLRGGPERLIGIDEKLAVQPRFFGRYGIVSLRDHIGRPLYAHYGTVRLVGADIVNQVYHDLMPCRIPRPRPGAGGEKSRSSLQFPFSDAEYGRNAAVYGNPGTHKESRCSRTLFETSAKSLGSIEYEARPFVRERMAVA